MEVCLHSIERECDLVGELEKVKVNKTINKGGHFS